MIHNLFSEVERQEIKMEKLSSCFTHLAYLAISKTMAEKQVFMTDQLRKVCLYCAFVYPIL